MGTKGTAWKFNDNIDTDAIIPARYLNTSDPNELAKHCMEDADANFMKNLKAGDFIVAGKNFGCGSSREHAPIAIKAAGVSCVIAKTFARIFYRNSFNMGLTILECEESDRISDHDELEVDTETGTISNLTKGEEYKVAPIPPFMQELINDGGLMKHVSKKL
jgi:3-isopropylmalate/(R)-2-methylmalate dehydratase small subunit